MEQVEKYIPQKQNMVAHYIAIHLIMDLCEEAVWRPVVRFSKWWWEHYGLDLEGVRADVEAATATAGEP